MISDKTFRELREYILGCVLAKNAVSACSVDDLVQDTMERVLRSETVAKIEMGPDELRAFAWTTMNHLIMDHQRATRRRAREKAQAEYVRLRDPYDHGHERELEIGDIWSRLTPRELHALAVIVEAGEYASQALTDTPGLSRRDLPRLRKKIKRELLRQDLPRLRSHPAVAISNSRELAR